MATYGPRRFWIQSFLGAYPAAEAIVVVPWPPRDRTIAVANREGTVTDLAGLIRRAEVG